MLSFGTRSTSVTRSTSASSAQNSLLSDMDNELVAMGLDSDSAARSSLLARIETFCFDALFAIVSRSSSKRLVSILVLLIEFAQIATFAFHDTFEWGSWADATIRPTLNLLALRVVFSSFTAFRVVNGCVYAALLFSYIDAVYVGLALRDHSRSRIWPLRMLRYAVGFGVTVLYIPIMSVLLTPLACDYTAPMSDQTLSDYDMVDCWEPEVIAYKVVSGIFAIAMILSTSALSLVYFQDSPQSGHLLARSHARIDCTIHLVKSILLLGFATVPQFRFILGIVMFIANSGVFVLQVLFMAIYNLKLQVARTGGFCILAWISGMALVTIPTDNNDSANIAFVVTAALAPVFFALGSSVGYLRLALLRKRHAACAVSPAVAAVADNEDETMHTIDEVGDRRFQAPRFWLVTDVELVARSHIQRGAPDAANAVFRAGFEQFPDSVYILLCYVRFLASVGNTAMAHAYLDQSLALPARADLRFVRYRKLREVEQAQLAHGLTVGAMDLISYVQFETKLRTARAHHKAAISALSNFWRTLLRSDRNFLARSAKLIARIDAAERSANDCYRELILKYPTAPGLLVSYAAFLDQVSNKPVLADRFLRRAKHVATINADDTGDGGVGPHATETEAEHREDGGVGVVNSAVDAIVTLGSMGQITSFNAQARKLYGYTSHAADKEIRGESFARALFAQPYSEWHEVILSSASSIPRVFLLDALATDGSTFPISFSIVRMSSHTGQAAASSAAYVAVIRPRAASDERIALYVSPAGSVTACSGRPEPMLSMNPRQLVSSPMHTLFPSDTRGMAALTSWLGTDSATSGSLDPHVRIIRHRNGRRLPCVISGSWLGGSGAAWIGMLVVEPIASYSIDILVSNGGKVIAVSDAIARALWGVSELELLGSDLSLALDIPPQVSPSALPSAISRATSLRADAILSSLELGPARTTSLANSWFRKPAEVAALHAAVANSRTGDSASPLPLLVESVPGAEAGRGICIVRSRPHPLSGTHVYMAAVAAPEGVGGNFRVMFLPLTAQANAVTISTPIPPPPPVIMSAPEPTLATSEPDLHFHTQENSESPRRRNGFSVRGSSPGAPPSRRARSTLDRPASVIRRRSVSRSRGDSADTNSSMVLPLEKVTDTELPCASPSSLPARSRRKSTAEGSLFSLSTASVGMYGGRSRRHRGGRGGEDDDETGSMLSVPEQRMVSAARARIAARRRVAQQADSDVSTSLRALRRSASDDITRLSRRMFGIIALVVVLCIAVFAMSEVLLIRAELRPERAREATIRLQKTVRVVSDIQSLYLLDRVEVVTENITDAWRKSDVYLREVNQLVSGSLDNLGYNPEFAIALVEKVHATVDELLEHHHILLDTSGLYDPASRLDKLHSGDPQIVMYHFELSDSYLHAYPDMPEEEMRVIPRAYNLEEAIAVFCTAARSYSAHVLETHGLHSNTTDAWVDTNLSDAVFADADLALFVLFNGGHGLRVALEQALNLEQETVRTTLFQALAIICSLSAAMIGLHLVAVFVIVMPAFRAASHRRRATIAVFLAIPKTAVAKLMRGTHKRDGAGAGTNSVASFDSEGSMSSRDGSDLGIQLSARDADGGRSTRSQLRSQARPPTPPISRSRARAADFSGPDDREMTVADLTKTAPVPMSRPEVTESTSFTAVSAATVAVPDTPHSASFLSSFHAADAPRGSASYQPISRRPANQPAGSARPPRPSRGPLSVASDDNSSHVSQSRFAASNQSVDSAEDVLSSGSDLAPPGMQASSSSSSSAMSSSHESDSSSGSSSSYGSETEQQEGDEQDSRGDGTPLADLTARSTVTSHNGVSGGHNSDADSVSSGAEFGGSAKSSSNGTAVATEDVEKRVGFNSRPTLTHMVSPQQSPILVEESPSAHASSLVETGAPLSERRNSKSRPAPAHDSESVESATQSTPSAAKHRMSTRSGRRWCGLRKAKKKSEADAQAAARKALFKSMQTDSVEVRQRWVLVGMVGLGIILCFSLISLLELQFLTNVASITALGGLRLPFNEDIRAMAIEHVLAEYPLLHDFEEAILPFVYMDFPALHSESFALGNSVKIVPSSKFEKPRELLSLALERMRATQKFILLHKKDTFKVPAQDHLEQIGACLRYPPATCRDSSDPLFGPTRRGLSNLIRHYVQLGLDLVIAHPDRLVPHVHELVVIEELYHKEMLDGLEMSTNSYATAIHTREIYRALPGIALALQMVAFAAFALLVLTPMTRVLHQHNRRTMFMLSLIPHEVVTSVSEISNFFGLENDIHAM